MLNYETHGGVTMDAISGSNALYSSYYNAQNGVANGVKTATQESENLVQSTTNQINGQNTVEANAQTIKTQDAMNQTLLDIMA